MQRQFAAIGTHWTVDILDPIDEYASDALMRLIDKRIEAFDVAYSRFRNDSLVMQMSQRVGTYELPVDAKPLFDFYKKLYELTEGAFTPLIGSTLSQAGYDANYSLVSQQVSAPVRWQDAIIVEYPNIEVVQPVLIDVGAAGKGYLIDIIATLIEQEGIKSFCIDAGGDIVHRSESNQVLDIALENPFDTAQAVGIAHIVNQSLCASAGNRRAWGEYTHIINPFTLHSPKDIAAVWVVAENGMVADGLATALFLVSPDTLINDFSFEYFIMQADSSILKSSQFPAELFYA